MDEFVIQTATGQITEAEILTRLLVAIGIGFLIGLEREHHALEKGDEAFAGIRTFVLLSLLGFIGGAAFYVFSPSIMLALMVGVILLICISYWITANKGSIGTTIEFAGVLVFILGALTFAGQLVLSLIITVLMMVLLSAKLTLQNLIGAIRRQEMYDLIRFVVVALLVFPLLPDEVYGPYDVFNPREVGWVVVLVSGVGLAGYVLMRVFGSKKGILITGIVGGLVSSTVVTWVFSKKARNNLNSVFNVPQRSSRHPP